MFSRTPRVWEVQVRRDLIESELIELRAIPYAVWRGMVGHPMSKQAVGRDERRYRIRVSPSWARSGSSDVRVTVVLETPALRRRLMRQSFVITPANELRD